MREEEKEAQESREWGGKKLRETGPSCSKGCGRLPYSRFPTCCTRCKGPDGPHAHDCDRRDEDEAPRKQIRSLFYQTKDRDHGLSHRRFKKMLNDLFPDEGLDRMIDECDKNGNGVIEIDEFLDWIWSSDFTDDDRDKLEALKDDDGNNGRHRTDRDEGSRRRHGRHGRHHRSDRRY